MQALRQSNGSELRPWQDESRAKAANRRRFQRNFAAIDFGEIANDGKTESRPWGFFIRSYAALKNVIAHFRIETGTIVLDEDGQARAVREGCDRDTGPRPYEGVIEKVPEHLVEVLALNLNAVIGRYG